MLPVRAVRDEWVHPHVPALDDVAVTRDNVVMAVYSPPRRCELCREKLSPFARADSRYCSTRCRMAAHRAQSGSTTTVPAELRQRDRWVRHRAKRPIQIDGSVATSTDPSTWASWAAVSTCSLGDGAGFVLDGDGVVCIDVDDCLSDAGRLLPWARPVLAQLPATYIEVSPSGRGLHIWGTGSLQRGRRLMVDGGMVELYGRARYMTVTGKRFRSAPSRLGDLSSTLASLMA